jgi:hypothetical protein
MPRFLIYFSFCFLAFFITSCSSDATIIEDIDPPVEIDSTYIDPETGGKLIEFGYSIDLNEDGINDFYFDGATGSSHGGSFSTMLFGLNHSNAFILWDSEYEIWYNSIDTTITYDTIQPFVRRDILKTHSCIPFTGPNVIIDTVGIGHWDWEQELMLVDSLDVRWKSQYVFVPFYSYPICEPYNDDAAPYIDEFEQICYDYIVDCHGLNETDEAYFNLMVKAANAYTLGYFKMARNEKGNLITTKVVRLN